MRRFVVGTAGHVDHGKTTLVQALTGVDTDRLPEEKRRGITIELGFAPWRLADDLELSVIDVPGHRRLVHTMIAGAAGMELVLLVVAADEGVMPQTREHVAACELLGITRAVVAITKLDRSDRELAALAGEEVGELLGRTIAHEVVLCSARTGEGLDDLRAALRRALTALPALPTASSPRLSVDRVFTIKGAGTVVTGTLVKGSIVVGDPLTLLSAERGARATAARGLHVHDHSVPRADAPTRLAINLSGVALEDVHRGDVVTSDPGAAPTTRFDARLTLFREVKATTALEVYVGTDRAPGRLQLLATPESPAEPSAEGVDEAPPLRLGRVRLEQPMVVVGGDRFVIRTSTSGRGGAVVGGGVVLDARPPALREKKRRSEALAAIARGDAAAAARVLLAERSPRPLAPLELISRFALAPGAVERALAKAADRGEIVRLGDDGFVDRDALARLALRVRELVSAHHADHPLDRGLKIETLRQKLAERAGMPTALEAIRLAAKKSLAGEPIVVEGDSARLAGFIEGGARTPSGPFEVARVFLVDAGLKGTGEFAIGEAAGVSGKEIKAILAKLVRDGAAVATGAQWFDARAVEALRERVVAHLAAHPALTIADFKDMSGLGRKQAIPLLELFDREGTTMRRGDDRVAGAKLRAAP